MGQHITAVALGVGLVLAVTPVGALAQAPGDNLHFSFGAGVTTPNTEVRDRVGSGYNILFSVQYDLTPIVSLEGFLSTSALGDTAISIPVSATPFTSPIPREFVANMTMQLATANLMVQMPVGAVRPYGLIGWGVYGRPVEITTTTIGWVSGYCDPWLYVCTGEGFTSVEQVVGRRSSTDIGIDVGGGANFGIFFSEVRYHHIWGPSIEAPQPGSGAPTVIRTLNGQFLAVSFGVRF